MTQTTGYGCPRCKAPLAKTANFCANCGADISGVWGPGGEPLGKTIAVEIDPNVDTLAQLLTTATLGEYDIYGELGRGGMAAVYLGLDLALNRKVAIKTMLPELVTREGMVERFKREAQTAAALSHPHIIQIFTVKQTTELVYFVMKFIEGRSLESVVAEKGKLSVEMAQIVLSQVASALAYAHRKHVVHRDIKPANIMIDEDGWAIVTDFGIAKVQEAQNLTATGTAIGTPHYMSPEQFHNKAITGASDQYSLGIVAYEMLLGRKPFDGATYAEIITQHLFEAPPDLRASRPDIPEPFANAIRRMLAKDPAERFPDLDAAATELGTPHKKEGDGVRTEMISLARNGPQKKVRMSVPISPIPMAKKPTEAAAATVVEKQGKAARPRPVVTASRSRAVPIAAGLLLVVGVGGFLGWKALSTGSEGATGPVAVAPATDSSAGTAVPGVVTPAGTQIAAVDSSPAPAPGTKAPQPPVAPPTKRAETKVASSQTKTPASRTERSTSAAPERTVSRPAASAEAGLATMRLIVNPPATLFIDNVSKGQQSRYSEQLIPGTHTVRVERDGWITKDTTVTISAGQPATIRINLTERP
jgi:hypothetical protein